MDRWWRNDIAAVATQIDALGKASATPDQATGVREIEVVSAAASCHLDCWRQLPELPLQAIEGDLAPVLRIDIEHDEIRYLAGDLYWRPASGPNQSATCSADGCVSSVAAPRRPTVFCPAIATAAGTIHGPNSVARYRSSQLVTSRRFAHLGSHHYDCYDLLAASCLKILPDDFRADDVLSCSNRCLPMIGIVETLSRWGYK
jgi:hypothetical protein